MSNQIIAPVLWLPISAIRKQEEMQREAELGQFYREHRRVPTWMETRCSALLRLIEQGDAEAAKELAKEVATRVYDFDLDRHHCEETGNVYFHACPDYDYY